MADTKIYLTELQSSKLLAFPEKGMGYQRVDVILKIAKYFIIKL